MSPLDAVPFTPSSRSVHPRQLLSYKHRLQAKALGRPFFSTICELPNLQALCFDIHANWWGVCTPAPGRLAPRRRLLHHLNENPVTTTPLDSVFTKRDARKSFRFCFYENCRGVGVFFPFWFTSSFAGNSGSAEGRNILRHYTWRAKKPAGHRMGSAFPPPSAGSRREGTGTQLSGNRCRLRRSAECYFFG
jgi:hypothetical protein